MGEFSTDVYCKPTDAHQYLNFGSCHPSHVKRGIPYGQGLRLKRICGSEEVLERFFTRERLYDHDFFDIQFLRVRNHDRGDFLESKKKLGNKDNFGDRVCCVVDYHPVMSCLKQIFKQLQDIVGLSAEFAKVLKEKPLLSFRRPKNLKDHLVRSKLRREEIRKMVWLSIRIGVKFAILSDRGMNLRVHITSRTYYVNHVFDCDSEEVVYLITCKKCGLQYVGNTVTSFRLRLNNHKSSMMRYFKGQQGMGGQKLYAHFYTEGHEGLISLEIQVIDVTDLKRPNERESFWIEKLNTYVLPKGIKYKRGGLMYVN